MDSRHRAARQEVVILLNHRDMVDIRHNSLVVDTLPSQTTPLPQVVLHILLHLVVELTLLPLEVLAILQLPEVVILQLQAVVIRRQVAIHLRVVVILCLDNLEGLGLKILVLLGLLSLLPRTMAKHPVVTTVLLRQVDMDNQLLHTPLHQVNSQGIPASHMERHLRQDTNRPGDTVPLRHDLIGGTHSKTFPSPILHPESRACIQVNRFSVPPRMRSKIMD